jgi:hypothetical protein
MPLGLGPIAARPICGLVDMTLPASVFASIPANSTLINTAEIFPSSGTRIAAADRPFRALPTDTLSNQEFQGTLKTPLAFHRTIVSGDAFGAMSSGYGEIELQNDDGNYDAIFQTTTIDGRRVLVRTGQASQTGPDWIPQSYDTFPVLFDGIAEDWHLDDATLRITIRDNAFKLDVPASPNVYGGTGGADGTADMAGKRKPRAFGQLTPDSGSGGNVSPPLIDPTNLVYQVNDGAVSTIPNVYDSGFALTGPTADFASYAALIAATIPDGSYATAKAVGMFRLGSIAFGTITCDTLGDASGTGYINDTASIGRRLISSSLVTQVDEGAFLTVTAAQPAAVGYYLGLDENKTVRQALDELFGGIGGWCGFRRDGTLDCGIFVAPTGTAVASFDYVDILDGSLRRLDLPAATNPPPYRRRVAGPRNWTVQTSLVAGVSATRAAMLANPFAVAISTNSGLTASIQAAHPLAKDPDPVEAFFALNATAVTEANRLLSLYGSAVRSFYSFRVKALGALLNIGNVISVTYPRFDLASGKSLTVVGIADVPNDGCIEFEITAWG